ncbi:MAG: hypothetical protein ACP5GX_05040 [Anaerolineae bacterium]
MTDLQILTSHLGAVAVGGALYVSSLLLTFSRRMNEVTRMRARYRWFRVGNILIGLAFFGYILLCSAALGGEPAFLLNSDTVLLIFHLPLALGIGINLIVTLLYWGWLLRKR